MADIRNDQYLHRPGAGRGAITPADPLETRLFDGSGNPIAPATETTLAVAVTRLESILSRLEGVFDISDRSNRALGQVQLTGRNAEIITLVDTVAVTDTDEHLSGVLSTLGKYRDYEIFVTNEHNQPVYIGFKFGGVYPRVVNSDGSLSDYNRWGKAHVVPAGARRVALSQLPLSGTNDKFPYKAFRQPDFRIAYQFVTAPTSGTISIWLVGILN